MAMDVRGALGADLHAGTAQITIFIPSVDRSGQEIGQEFWREEALAVLGRAFRGATAFPPGRGVWRDDKSEGRLLFERIGLVTSYAREVDMTEESMHDLRKFLHRMGRQARQGEVGVVVDGVYWPITTYDES